MDLPAITTPLAAFAAGLVTSLHCAGMCGPLACAMRVKPASYHTARIISYTAVGALLGSIGGMAEDWLHGSFAKALPWAMAAVLLALGLGLEKKLPPPRWAANWLLRRRLGASLGWLTPLLPCGPLYLLFGVAVVAGSWSRGALLMASFSIGTVPLYWLLQSQALRALGWLSPRSLRWTQQGLALVSAALLAWRAMMPGDACCQ